MFFALSSLPLPIFSTNPPISLFMASKTAVRSLLSLALRRIASNSPAQARRSLTTRSINLQLSRAPIKPTLLTATLQRSFRRSYADAIPPKPRRRIRTFFRWTWRLTYLSAIGGIGYLAYTIYEMRRPTEQIEADPSKKTLVILGMPARDDYGLQPLTCYRHWMGSYISA